MIQCLARGKHSNIGFVIIIIISNKHFQLLLFIASNFQISGIPSAEHTHLLNTHMGNDARKDLCY